MLLRSRALYSSTWAFGSVGTVRFILRKAEEGTWSRLTSSNETFKNHRVWWEKQEQVERDDRKAKDLEERKVREAREEEERKVKEAEAAAREAQQAEERAKVNAERIAKRIMQKPALEAAIAAFDEFSISEADALDQHMITSLNAAKELLRVTGQETNETAAANAEQMLNAMRSLRSTGFKDLTAEASNDLTVKYKSWLEAQIEPAPETIPGVKKSKKKGKKKHNK